MRGWTYLALVGYCSKIEGCTELLVIVRCAVREELAGAEVPRGVPLCRRAVPTSEFSDEFSFCSLSAGDHVLFLVQNCQVQ
jgi:hypothetical protein